MRKFSLSRSPPKENKAGVGERKGVGVENTDINLPFPDYSRMTGGNKGTYCFNNLFTVAEKILLETTRARLRINIYLQIVEITVQLSKRCVA